MQSRVGSEAEIRITAVSGAANEPPELGCKVSGSLHDVSDSIEEAAVVRVDDSTCHSRAVRESH